MNLIELRNKLLEKRPDTQPNIIHIDPINLPNNSKTEIAD